MTVEELLEELEGLPHAGRVRAMIALGRRHDIESRALLAQLSAGRFYERYLALYACFGTRESAPVLAAIADRSRILRGLAAQLVPLVCTREEIAQALDAAPAGARLTLLWRLRKRGPAQTQAVVDAFLERLAAAADSQLPRLLPFGSASVVARLATDYAAHATPAQWARLAQFHPAIALDLLRQWAERAPEQDESLVQTANQLLSSLARADADRTLALVRTLRRVTPPYTTLHLGQLARQLANEVADLVLSEPSGRVRFSLSGVAHRLAREQRLALLERQPGTLTPYETWLARLPAQERAETVTAGGRWLRRNGILDTGIVALLPRALREAEARAHLASPRLAPLQRLPYASYLPWDEALAALDSAMRSSDTSQRQVALGALLAAVPYHRERLPDALALLVTRRSEQDPVRRVMLRGLGLLPAGIWQPEHLPDLAEIVRHGLNDVGLSRDTQRHMLTLLLKLAPRHFNWCAEQLQAVLRERGWVAPEYPLAALPDGVAARLAEALRPVLYIWLARENDDAVLAALGDLEAVVAASAPLLPLAEELLLRAETRDNAQRALALIAASAPARLDELVPALLAQDASWITVPPVARYLLRHRQDLLPPFLRQERYAGRWSTGRKRYLLPLDGLFTQGSARQQERYAVALMETIGDPAEESWAITRAIKSLALLPALPPTRLVALSEDARSVVRTTALFALSRLDSDAGLEALITATGDSRARIAMHALRPFLLAMPPARALAILRGVPLDRVTVAKEVVRAMGALLDEAGYAELLALDRQPLQRDVRIALLRTLARYVDRMQTWDIFERAAGAPDESVAATALPGDMAALRRRVVNAGNEGEAIQQRIFRVIGLLLARPEQSVRLGALRACVPLTLPDLDGVVVPRLLELARTGTPLDAEPALRALFAICAERDAAAIGAFASEMLPNRRRLIWLLQASRAQYGGQRSLVAVRSVLEALAAAPLTATARVELALARLPSEEWAAFFARMAANGELHAEALITACETIVNQAWSSDARRWQPLEAALATSEDAALRRIALAALVGQTRKAQAWSDEQRARLQRFQADPSPLVAAAAQFTLSADEEGDEEP
jgi:hypothetical protein